MSVKIRVSYTEDWEREAVLALLSPVLKGCKISGNMEGYKKAYPVVDNERLQRYQSQRSDSQR